MEGLRGYKRFALVQIVPRCRLATVAVAVFIVAVARWPIVVLTVFLGHISPQTSVSVVSILLLRFERANQ